MRSQQLTDSEKRPGGERPPTGGDDPALVGAAREQSTHRERERNGEPDVAEVEHRRVDRHVRVLQARIEAGAVGGRGLCRERARDEYEQHREERADEPERRHDPGEHLAACAPSGQHGRDGIAGEHEQPEEQGPFLTAPEGGQRVAERQLVTRMVGDVLEREVVSSECSEQHGGRDEGRAEGGEQRVLRRLGEPATLLPRRKRTCDERVDEQQERRDERRSAEIGHQCRR